MRVELSDSEARLIEHALAAIRTNVPYRQGLPHAVFTRLIQAQSTIRAAIAAANDKPADKPLVWSS